MTVRAILFGSIGTLVETSDIQRRAFNRAFAEAGLDWNWSIDTYKLLLKKSGGRNRIQDYAFQQGINVDANILHQRKTEIFDAFMADGNVPLRLGIDNVIQFAKKNNIELAFVTSTSNANIDAVFSALSSQVTRDDFAFVGNDAMVTKPKPSPEIYTKALSDLGLKTQSCIAVEDTETSMQAALNAGIRCIAFPGAYAAAQDFSGALLTTSYLSLDHFRAPKH
ncbi:protein CbbY [Octadecabacter antarcticus 307]|uniref:Protein CbbY n=1 Tax=Octadecabacter antarcticus 307 TaxID=391626 RepID=M9RAL2_9RHOB|nr:HAD-IA family hydrolase [Octadecabacter antarcticus]AGI66800.1 protein CbbY [Octadecabacter antarcticus 307]